MELENEQRRLLTEQEKHNLEVELELKRLEQNRKNKDREFDIQEKQVKFNFLFSMRQIFAVLSLPLRD